MSALAAVLAIFVHFPLIPAAPFLKWDMADIPVLVVGFFFGPAAALVVTVIMSIAMSLAVGVDGPFGAFMHILATGTFAVVASYIYMKKDNLAGAVTGLIAGTLSMTAVMAIANLLLDPIFYGMPFQAVLKLMVPAILPFNLIKGALSSVLAYPVFRVLRHLPRFGLQRS